MHTDYSAFEKCVSAIKLYAEKYNYSVGFPYKIGCGLAGGDWEIVLKIIKKYFEKLYDLPYMETLSELFAEAFLERT